MVDKKNKEPVKANSKKNNSKKDKQEKKQDILDTVPERRKMRKAIENINLEVTEKKERR